VTGATFFTALLGVKRLGLLRELVRRSVERFGDIVAYPVLGGLHHRYARI
jgi:hypothetical protein